MPQVYLILDIKAQLALGDFHTEELQQKLILLVEKEWNLQGLDDVASTAISASSVVNEKNVQIEVRYTAGTDEYDRGEIFEPSREEQEALAKQVMATFKNYVSQHKLYVSQHKFALSASVWIKPYYNSTFLE